MSRWSSRTKASTYYYLASATPSTESVFLSYPRPEEDLCRHRLIKTPRAVPSLTYNLGSSSLLHPPTTPGTLVTELVNWIADLFNLKSGKFETHSPNPALWLVNGC